MNSCVYRSFQPSGYLNVWALTRNNIELISSNWFYSIFNLLVKVCRNNWSRLMKQGYITMTWRSKTNSCKSDTQLCHSWRNSRAKSQQERFSLSFSATRKKFDDWLSSQRPKSWCTRESEKLSALITHMMKVRIIFCLLL